MGVKSLKMGQLTWWEITLVVIVVVGMALYFICVPNSCESKRQREKRKIREEVEKQLERERARQTPSVDSLSSSDLSEDEIRQEPNSKNISIPMAGDTFHNAGFQS